MDSTTQQIRRLLKFLKLDAELEDHAVIHDSIEKGIVFKGTNLWILVFAIVVASVGLNMNSTAVIIGAMLISPLMGPINGIGYSIATYNIDLLKRSLKNFSFAVIASIFASFLYFLLSPVSNAQSELLARTSPTIFDVLIALFGGFAGIVAMSSKQKGNVIPGVAIATALMPPLCTVGYGLATGNSTFFLGALYLFTINTVFIALSSMIVTQILKFPVKPFITDRFKLLTKWTLWIVISITVLPSFYFGYTLVQKEHFQNQSEQYVKNVSVYENNYLLKSEVDASKRSIKLVYAGKELNKEDKQAIIDQAKNFELENCFIDINQGFNLNSFNQANSELDNLQTKLNQLNYVINKKDQQIDSLKKIDEYGKTILKELKSFYPSVHSSAYARTKLFTEDSIIHLTLVRLQSSEEINDGDKGKIYSWLANRIPYDSLIVDYE